MYIIDLKNLMIRQISYKFKTFGNGLIAFLKKLFLRFSEISYLTIDDNYCLNRLPFSILLSCNSSNSFHSLYKDSYNSVCRGSAIATGFL